MSEPARISSAACWSRPSVVFPYHTGVRGKIQTWWIIAKYGKAELAFRQGYEQTAFETVKLACQKPST